MYAGVPTRPACRAVDRLFAALRVAARSGRAGPCDRLRHAEVEQLGQQPPGALEHDHVGGLDVAVDDALLVRGVDHLAQPLEERHEPVERHRAVRGEPAIERRPAHVLHRDPQHAPGLRAERIDVRGVRVVEPRREPGFAQEPLDGLGPIAMALVQHLDDRLAAEHHLLGPVDDAVAALAQPLDHDEVTQGGPLDGRG
jgi:hypothetical protein